MKREVVHSLVSGVMESLMKPGRISRPSDRTFHGMVTIPYVTDISEKILFIEIHFNFRAIFRTNHKSVGH